MRAFQAAALVCGLAVPAMAQVLGMGDGPAAPGEAEATAVLVSPGLRVAGFDPVRDVPAMRNWRAPGIATP
jgi:hypothetical protein